MTIFTGLFERHKLLFSFNLTVKIEQAEGRAPQEELDFFLKGDILTKLNDVTVLQTGGDHQQRILLYHVGNLSLEKSQRKKPCDWLPDRGWEDVVRLTELFPNQFGSLMGDIEKNTTQWKDVRWC